MKAPIQLWRTLIIAIALLLVGQTALAQTGMSVITVEADQCSGTELAYTTRFTVTIPVNSPTQFSMIGPGYAYGDAGFTAIEFTPGDYPGVRLMLPPFNFPANTLVTFSNTYRDSAGQVLASHTTTFNCTTGAIVATPDDQATAIQQIAFTDGRLSQDAASSVAVYPSLPGFWSVYAIDAAGRGSLAFNFDCPFIQRALDARRDGGEDPRFFTSGDQPQGLIAGPLNQPGGVGPTSFTGNFVTTGPGHILLLQRQGPRGMIRLWLLTTGELQLNSPGQGADNSKETVYIWNGCPGLRR
jgi:hypothetical protein